MNTLKMIVRVIIAAFGIVIVSCSQQHTQQAEFSTDGTLIVLSKSDNTATLISLQTGEVTATILTGAGPHEGIVSPDGKTLVVSDYGTENPSTLTVINLTSKEVTDTIELGNNVGPHGIVYFPDGERVLVSTEESKTVAIVNILTGMVEQSITTGDNTCHMISITPSGERAFASSIGKGTILAIDLVSGDVIKTIATGDGAEGIDISPDGREVWVGNRAENTVSVIDTETLEIVAELKSESFPIRVKFTFDGQYVLVSNMTSNEVAVFDATSRSEIRRIPMIEKEVADTGGRVFEDAEGAAPIGILVHPNNQHVFIANTRADVVSVIDLHQWKVVTRLQSGREPDGMAYSSLAIE